MSNRTDHHEFEDHVPADIADVAGLLDALGEVERASMPRAFAERVCAASALTLLHPEGEDAAAEAGVIAASVGVEGEDAPDGLEDRVFEASRGELAKRGGLKLAGEGVLPVRVVTRAVWWQTGAMRMAAAAAIVGACMIGYVAVKSAESPEAASASSAMLATSFDSEMEAFFDLLESSPASGTAETSVGTDHSITDALLEWESL